MLEADITILINTILYPLMPVITVLKASAIMLSDLPWNDDNDGCSLFTPIYSYAPQ